MFLYLISELAVVLYIFTSYTMGFYEIPVDIRAIFWYFFCIPRAFRRVEYRKKIAKNYENITGIS